MTLKLTYLDTHPWIKFGFNLEQARPELWLQLGEIRSKCDHLSGVPLVPETAQRLHTVFLAKGVHATAAIEGNTLTEEQVKGIIEKRIDLPASQKYLKDEIQNVISAADSILAEVEGQGFKPITVEQINGYNRQVLQGLKVEDHVVPGEFRKCSVGVINYRGAPWEECDHLMDKLVDWLNGPTFKPPSDEFTVVYGVIKAVMAHLYIAWIHPFGDGNGRTARFLEVRFLLEAGVPSAAAHLLSNHYNMTRSEYYRQLDLASKSGGNVMPFLCYAVLGLRDQMREQLKWVKIQQWEVAWTHYVHNKFAGKEGAKDVRQLALVLALGRAPSPIPTGKLKQVAPEVAEKYAQVEDRTLYRDLKELLDMELIEEVAEGYKARKDVILAMLPRAKKGDVEKQRDETLPLLAGLNNGNFDFAHGG